MDGGDHGRRRTDLKSGWGIHVEDLGSVVSGEERNAIDDAIRHMYSPDLKSGWGIHVVQEVKLLAKKEDQEVKLLAKKEDLKSGWGIHVVHLSTSFFFLECKGFDKVDSS